MPLAHAYVVAADGNPHTLLAGIHDLTNRHNCNEIQAGRRLTFLRSNALVNAGRSRDSLGSLWCTDQFTPAHSSAVGVKRDGDVQRCPASRRAGHAHAAAKHFDPVLEPDQA